MKKLFTVFLSLVLILSVFGYSTADTQNWAGTWYRHEANTHSIIISNITNKSFDFHIRFKSGINMDKLEGTAQIVAPQKAVFNSDTLGNIVYFNFTDTDLEIVSELKKNKSYTRNLWYSPDGYYTISTPNIDAVNERRFDHFQILNPRQKEVFKALTGVYYESFVNNTQIISTARDIDDFNTKVTTAGINGLFTICEAIYMVRDSDNAIWAATIKDNKVYYFTNTNTSYIPKTILKWQERFREKPII